MAWSAMCNRYVSPEEAEIERFWHIGRSNPVAWARDLSPRGTGPFLRRWNGPGLGLEAGQWGMIPPNSEDRIPRAKPKPGKERGAILSTNNARSDRMETAWTYRFPWKDGKRCLIPAWLFIEPNWETGSNIWWQFRRTDGRPWALAGLWNEWTDPKTGEVVPNYTMITVHANDHPIMSRMHKPEVDSVSKKPLPLDQQDKRSVVSIEAANMEQWLTGTQEDAKALLKPPAMEVIEAGPA